MKTVAEQLFESPFAFDFFQAVWLLETVDARRKPIGREGPPILESVRFRTFQSLNFPASAIQELDYVAPLNEKSLPPPPIMTVTFLGLTGPNGALPVHYTQLILRLLREGKGHEKTALRDWFDLFNHRLTALFYRAWEKYRFTKPFLRFARAKQLAEGSSSSLAESLVLQARRTEPDLFTLSLYNLIGLGVPSLRGREQVTVRLDEGPAGGYVDPEHDILRLAHVEDLALLHFGGFFVQRPRNAINLEALLAGYFRLSVRVEQFSGQWLRIDPARQSRLEEYANNELERNVVVGEQVWDAISKFRVRLGPLDYRTFAEFLPDAAANPRRKAYFLLSQLVRLYVGMEYDFEIQLVLKGGDVPECQLREETRDEIGARLGWNTWMPGGAMPDDVDDAYFDALEGYELTK